MANKTFNTRICLKNDTYANWIANDPIPLKGEVCVVVIPAETGAVQGEPVTLFKVGDGTKKFSQLDFIGAKAADVYSWAKAVTKPEYTANEIKGLADYISGEIQDTDTQYKLEADADDAHKFYLYSKPLNGSWNSTPVSTITIPETVYTLVEGTANGTVKFNGTDVKVHGLGSAAYTDADAYDAKGDADAALVSAKAYADGKDAAIAAAKKAGDDAQSSVDALSDKVGTVTDGKTVVEMIADAKTAATYDDTAVKASIKANADAITILNGTSAVEGSVDKKVADAINEFATKVSDDQTVNTFKELIDYAATHQGEYSTLSGEVQKNTTAIATLNGKDTVAGSVAKTVKDAVDAAQATLQGNIDGKVDKVTGKGLSTNDYTNDEKAKLDGIAEGAQVNVIETVKVNGVALTPSAKAVDVIVPTGTLADKNEVAKADLAAALKTEIEGKVNSADCGDIISHNAAEFATAGHNHDTVYSKLDHNHKIEELEQEVYIVLDCGSASTII
uniref:Hyaluronidase n=1 Tax=virus sp. ctoC338 TaxID=2827997 RepID=A0A8S5SXG3_9VIRU|nr:MAG TPA: hyaluronidase [virus sp. ctoC338]